MRTGWLIGCVAWVLASVASAYAVTPPPIKEASSTFAPTRQQIDSVRLAQRDTTARSASQQRTERLYDSLRVKSERNRLSKALYRAFFRSHRDTTQQGEVRDERAVLAPYAGKRVASIHIERLRPFNVDGNWFERTANNLHTRTRTHIIWRDLLFKEGDRLDPELVARTKQLLQSRSYLSDVDFSVAVDPLDTTQVNLLIRTRDSWTVDVDAGVHSGGEASLELSESNLFGRGHKIAVETNLNYRNFDYGGNVFAYEIANLLGSFHTFRFAAGRAFDESRFAVGIEKAFLRPNDYEMGATYENNKLEHYFRDRDTTELVRRRAWNFWTGLSQRIEGWDAIGYLAMRYHHYNTGLRPLATNAATNPYLHDHDMALVSIGLYREHFYSANMIYGYGRREYLATGFKSELVAGYRWGEFNDDFYLGLSHAMGGFLGVGYLRGSVAVGAPYNCDANRWHRVTLDADVDWFSNLFRFNRTSVRQFVNLNYTVGWNRGVGADEQIVFTKTDGLRALNEYVVGTNRLTLNTETVFFTPYKPLGFRMAVYGFLDGGFLGYHDNIFRNDGFCSLGVGLRLRNERLVFRAIQIQLGVAFGPQGCADSRYFRMTSQSSMQAFRYNPKHPEMLPYE